jgi:hypothetical protein
MFKKYDFVQRDEKYFRLKPFLVLCSKCLTLVCSAHQHQFKTSNININSDFSNQNFLLILSEEIIEKSIHVSVGNWLPDIGLVIGKANCNCGIFLGYFIMSADRPHLRLMDSLLLFPNCVIIEQFGHHFIPFCCEPETEIF